jgi:hypothetical protein
VRKGVHTMFVHLTLTGLPCSALRPLRLEPATVYAPRLLSVCEPFAGELVCECFRVAVVQLLFPRFPVA